MSYFDAYEAQMYPGYASFNYNNPNYNQYYNNTMTYYSSNNESNSNNGFSNSMDNSNFTNLLPSTSQNVQSVENDGRVQERLTNQNNGAIRKRFNNNGNNNSNKQYWQNSSNNNNRRYNNSRNFNNGRNYSNKKYSNNYTGNRDRYRSERDVDERVVVNEALVPTTSTENSEIKQTNNNKSKYNNHRNGNGRNYYNNTNNNNNNNRREKYFNNYYGDNYNNSGSGSSSNRQYYNNDNKYNKFNRNWRSKTKAESTLPPPLSPPPPQPSATSRREQLKEMLIKRELECLICCEKIKNLDKIWSCQQCHVIIHFNCIKEWINTSKLDNNNWRCPACQYVNTLIPKYDKCYCGKLIEPKFLPGVLPHACGELCERKGRFCEHKCTLLCHPGPCPDCQKQIQKQCGCGNTKQLLSCHSNIQIECTSLCLKLLNCNVHQCNEKCHQGFCQPCNNQIQQLCYCGKNQREINCTKENYGIFNYTCNEICEKLLTCNNHKCEELCHDGLCKECKWDINLIKTCPCGRTELINERKSCLDPIPTCNQICGKILNCGQPNAPHTCQLKCHEGDCPPCPQITMVRCRCGHMDKELPCQELTTKADDARCEKKCTKKRQCGKHRCNQRCCIEIEHICPLPCNHLLACGQHRCERTCHSGRCPTCIETSFEELYCECGTNVLYPPIPCGTKPPQCTNPCSRQRECGHDVNHTCHTGPCPPCTILCKRWCYGKHEQRSAIPCHQNDFSCGLPCGKDMPCGKHKCNKICHLGACPLPCKQPCNIKRQLCGHACNAPCHQLTCPDIPCKANVKVTCECGLQQSIRNCIEVLDEFKSIEMANLKEKMANLAMKDQTIDVTDIINKNKIKPTVLKILECTEECRVLERNRRLAIGLQIQNPDLSQKLTPRYSEFMRQWAKKDSIFCQRVHDKLTELVQLAKQSKQKSRSYSFDSMNRDKRHFIHEYCEHFGCESAAYDMEPNRNIVATAIKDKSWLPSMSLLQVIQRENGQRKVPGPVLNKNNNNNNNNASGGSSNNNNNVNKLESVSLKLPAAGRLLQKPSNTS